MFILILLLGGADMPVVVPNYPTKEACAMAVFEAEKHWRTGSQFFCIPGPTQR